MMFAYEVFIDNSLAPTALYFLLHNSTAPNYLKFIAHLLKYKKF